MAVTTITTSQAVAGNSPSAPSYDDRVSVAFDSTYETGGIAYDPKSVIGDKTIVGIGHALMDDGNLVVWDAANAKLQVFEYPDAKGPATEIANATDLTGRSVVLNIQSQ